MIDPRTWYGKSRYDAKKVKQLSEISKHKLYTKARRKQISCGMEYPVYHKPVLDLPKTDCFDDNKKSRIKSIFSKINSFVDNKPSGVMDPKWIKDNHRIRDRRYKENIKRHNEFYSQYKKKINSYNGLSSFHVLN